MSLPRIYADFMGYVLSPRDGVSSGVVLDTRGSARDLANLGIRLRDGIELVVFCDSSETEDLEADAVVCFDHKEQFWVAELRSEIRYIPTQPISGIPEHLCLQCRLPLPADKFGFATVDRCPHCGTLPYGAIDPP